MNDEDLCFTSATELAQLVRTREVSPVEITQAVIDRIERFDGRINAFSRFAPYMAMRMARTAEAAVVAGDPLGPLHGVPVTIKDLFDLEGFVTESGSQTQATATGKQAAGTDSPRRSAPEDRRRRHPRQDHDPRVRLDRREPKPLKRDHPQPLEARLQRRRLLRRFRCRRRSRLRAAAPRLRRRRLHPNAGALQWRLRHQAHMGTSAPRSCTQQRPGVTRWPVIPHRRRCRALSECHRWRSPTGPHEPHRTRARLHGEPIPRRRGPPSRVQPQPRPRPSRSRSRHPSRRRRANLRIRRLRRRGSEPGMGPPRPRNRPLLLVRSRSPLGAIPRRVGVPNGPWPRRLHPRRHRPLRRGLHGHARPQARLHRTPKPLSGQLGPAAHPSGLRRRLPRHQIAARTLARTPVGLALLGRILLPPST